MSLLDFPDPPTPKSLNPITCLQEYIRIRTDHPNPDYDLAINYLIGIAKHYGFGYEVIQLTEKNKALLVYYLGSDKTLDPILLNSHIDVVQVEPEKWTHDPFEGKIVDGLLYGRGSQDMKSIGIQHLHALAKLKLEHNFTPQRTIILSFVPDEEIMGFEGMYLLVKHLPPIAFAIDEGLPSENDRISIFHGERKQWWLKLESSGEAGHGSKYVKHNAFENLHHVIDKIIHFSKLEKAKLDHSELSDVITINVNYISAGNPSSYNVIPSFCEAGLDIRIPPTHEGSSPSIDLIEFKQMISEWCDKHNVKYSFQNGTHIDATVNKTTDKDNPWIKQVTNFLNGKGIETDVSIFQASTDAQFLRTADIPTIGMSLIRHTTVLLHDHDEYIPLKSFIEGIDMYVDLLKKLC
jgi:aminoacylase